MKQFDDCFIHCGQWADGELCYEVEIRDESNKPVYHTVIKVYGDKGPIPKHLRNEAMMRRGRLEPQSVIDPVKGGRPGECRIAYFGQDEEFDFFEGKVKKDDAGP